MKSTYLANAQTNALRGTSFSVATVYTALFTVLPTIAGTGGTEVSGGSYARVAATLGAASSGKITSTADVLFATASAAWGSVLGYGFYDASSAGNLLYTDYLSSTDPAPFTAATSGTITAPAHGLVLTDRVILEANEFGIIPGGVSATTPYWVVSSSTDTFTVSLTSGGSAITISSSGGGLFRKIVVKTVALGDQFKFDSGQLSIQEK